MHVPTSRVLGVIGVVLISLFAIGCKKEVRAEITPSSGNDVPVDAVIRVRYEGANIPASKANSKYFSLRRCAETSTSTDSEQPATQQKNEGEEGETENAQQPAGSSPQQNQSTTQAPPSGQTVETYFAREFKSEVVENDDGTMTATDTTYIYAIPLESGDDIDTPLEEDGCYTFTANAIKYRDAQGGKLKVALGGTVTFRTEEGGDFYFYDPHEESAGSGQRTTVNSITTKEFGEDGYFDRCADPDPDDTENSSRTQSNEEENDDSAAETGSDGDKDEPDNTDKGGPNQLTGRTTSRTLEKRVPKLSPSDLVLISFQNGVDPRKVQMILCNTETEGERSGDTRAPSEICNNIGGRRITPNFVMVDTFSEVDGYPRALFKHYGIYGNFRHDARYEVEVRLGNDILTPQQQIEFITCKEKPQTEYQNFLHKVLPEATENSSTVFKLVPVRQGTGRR